MSILGRTQNEMPKIILGRTQNEMLSVHFRENTK